jgi:hypothetical protein
MTDENTLNGWVKLYSPHGALITFPLSMTEPIDAEKAALVMLSVDNLINAGFTANISGLEEGELMEKLSAVARREGSDENRTPIVDFYSANTRLSKKILHAYLNTTEDIAAFESATGLKLDMITVYDGKIAIDRADRNAAKYIKALPHVIKVVYKISPRWEQWKAAGGEGQEPHKKLLVRYEVNRKAEPSPAIPGETKDEQPEDPNTKQYKKLGNELVSMIVKQMGLKPSEVTPILAKIPGDTISFPSAIKLIETNLAPKQDNSGALPA